MLEGERANIMVSLNIPGTKVMAAAELVLDQYKTLVEDAIKEVRQELCNDEFFKNELKRGLMEELKKIVKQELTNTMEKAVRNVYGKNYAEDVEEIIFNAILPENKK